MNKRSILVMLILAFGAAGFEPVTIKGPEHPTVSERTAVRDLRHYLDLSLRQGMELEGRRTVVIHVGDTEFARRHQIFPDALNDDQWVMRSIGDQIVLVGGGSRGTLYAVYRFLEEFVGVHWWTESAETVPVHEQPLRLAPFSKVITPAFILRNIFPDNTARKDRGEFAIRNRLNSFGDHSIAEEYGGALRFGSPDSSHTFDAYMPVKDYMRDHPEYFSLVGGQRIGGQFTGQLCLTNPDVVAEFIRKVKAYIVQDEARAAAAGVPAPTIYDISQNDNSVVCQCDRCTRVIAEEGAKSGLILRFVNQVAAAVKEFRPRCWVSTLAYMTTENPPRKTRPANNVIIRLCNTSHNKAAPIWAPEQAPFRQKVLDWQAIAPALYVWEYSVHYGPAQPPYPSEYYIADKLNFYRTHGVKFMFMEHEFPEKGDMYFLKTWLETKLLEDPGADTEALITAFLNGYYGKAGPHLGRYRRLLRDSALRHNSFVHVFMESATHLDLETITKGFECFAQAEAAVHDDPVLRARVAREKFNLLQAAMIRYRKLTGEWLAGGRRLADFPWSRPELWAQLDRQWRTNIAAYTVEKYRPERLADLEEFHRLYARGSEVVGAPKRFRDWAAGAMDMTVDLAKTHGHPVVADPESEAGFAVFVDLSKTDKKGAVPLEFGAYSDTRAESLGQGVITPDRITRPGYNYYYCMTVTPEFSGLIYFLWDWRIQFTLDRAAAECPGQRYDVYVSVRFSGRSYPHSAADQPWGIYIDRCVLVPWAKAGPSAGVRRSTPEEARR